MISSISSTMGSYGMGSLKEMQQRIFQKADSDGDGQISKAELSSMRTNGPQGGPSADEMFTKLDTDQDGSISREECDASLEKMREQMSQGAKMFFGRGDKAGQPPSLEEMQEEMFTRADANGDGTIDADELATMAANGPEGRPTAEELLAQLDSDEDGVLSRAESDAGIERMHQNRPPGPPPGMEFGQTASDSDASDSLTQNLLDAMKNEIESSTTSTAEGDGLSFALRAALKSYMQASLSESSRNYESLGVLGSQMYA
jgi:Ca2+-binding EF-hand superfamily protein